MATTSGTPSLRKAFGALKDSTMVGMAKVNSEYKDLDVPILKATNHVELLPKEKHVRTIFGALSGSSSRSTVSYCIHGLARRLAKTRSWPVALKTLIVIHRALREVDQSFVEELTIYDNSVGHMLNLLHFKDDSSPSAWDYSSWIRSYALYLEECLECFRVLKYDFHRDHTRTKKFDTHELLDQLPALQQLLFRLIACEPVGAARYNVLISYALSIVASESVRLYVAITDGVLYLVDKFFEMQRRHAVRALEIYRKSVEQAEMLSEFFEMCRSLKISQKYVHIKKAPPTFLASMEEYVKDAPQMLMLPWKPDDDNRSINAKDVPEKADSEADPKEAMAVDSQESPEPAKSVEPPPLIPDLLSWDEPCQEASELNEKNSASLSTATPEESSDPSSSDLPGQPAGWELALVTTTKPEVTSVQLIKDGGVDRSTLDSLYEMAMVQANPNPVNYTAGFSSNPFEASVYNQQQISQPHHFDQPNFYQMDGIPQNQAAFGMQHQQNEQLVFGHDYMPTAGIHQPQLEQSMVIYDQTQFSHIPQQQNPQQEASIVGHDFMPMAGIPIQQESSIEQQEQTIGPDRMQMAQNSQTAQVSTQNEQLVDARDSGNPFGDPFIESTHLPQAPSSVSSLI